jgi:drug/metabolite transporter (DMT)-like permease
VGSVPFNLVRLVVAVVLLGSWSHTAGLGLKGGWLVWFVLSGMIGFGLGDMAGYTALARLGSRLSMLVVHCLAMPFGAVIEWAWLGTTLTWLEVALALGILGGVAVASALPKEYSKSPRDLWIGLSMCVCAALAQACGAVLSRKAYAVAAVEGVAVDAGTATYQRTIGGVAMVFLGALLAWRGGVRDQARVPPWIVLHALTGPVVGVACFQWALSSTPAGLVLPVLATIPLMVMPLAYWLEGEKPTRRAIVGGLLAVISAATLAATR